MNTGNEELIGLSNQEIEASRLKNGKNIISDPPVRIWSRIFDLLKDPMLVLLLVAATMYLINHQYSDAIFMLMAIILVTGISVFQESRSKNALKELKKLTQPFCKVIRNTNEIKIIREDLVVDDILILEEGMSVAADAIIINAHDFAVDESTLTGESLAVSKNKQENVYMGTTVVGGRAICKVTSVGIHTRIGQLGKSLIDIDKGETPLQKQINNFVKKMAAAGILVFLIVWVINYLNTQSFSESLIKSLTLAMSILPEEIPVAFTTFMALGAWRLSKLGIIVKDIKTVETLGSANILCVDKTGTITENRMELHEVLVAGKHDPEIFTAELKSAEYLIETAMWASEPIPFDPMEISIHEAYTKLFEHDKRKDFKLVHEYPLSGTPPMMTHIFANDETTIIAAKGAPEAILRLCNLDKPDHEKVLNGIRALTLKGLRVLAVAQADWKGDSYPSFQHEFQFRYVGLLGFYDPPKKNIKQVLQSFYDAGLEVKIITGDNAITTATIAKEINFKGLEHTLTGDDIVKLSSSELKDTVLTVNIFSRMFPEAKLKILNALKSHGKVVAMTGDGVNDAPALKSAHIGIAMGIKGSEIAKEVSPLVLSDDDLSKMVSAIAMGRKIYSNLKKAIQYIISIHIPIILIVFIPLILGWAFPSIFSPIHIIFLELIMGPTCSIIYENEPIEENLMKERPRAYTETFFNFKEISLSIIQGLMITAGALFIYQWSLDQGANENVLRTLVFINIITANIFLTLVNRSFNQALNRTLQYKNHLLWIILSITIILTISILLIPPVRSFFEFELTTIAFIGTSVLVGFISVIWFEIYKAIQLKGK